jgi:hypothetical protein
MGGGGVSGAAHNGKLRPLRDRVAMAIYENAPGPLCPWDDLPPGRKTGWLSDADCALGVALHAAAWVADATDPDKPANYLFRREHIGNNIRGLLYGN